MFKWRVLAAFAYSWSPTCRGPRGSADCRLSGAGEALLEHMLADKDKDCFLH